MKVMLKNGVNYGRFWLAIYAELQGIFSYKKENIAPLGHFSMMFDNEYLVI